MSADSELAFSELSGTKNFDLADVSVAGESGEGRGFVVGREFTSFSEIGLLDFKEGDLAGVSGLGLFVLMLVGLAINSVGFIEISTLLAFLVGDKGLGVSNFGSPLLLLFGEFWRNCDRLFRSSLLGDEGCAEKAFSVSTLGVDGMLDASLNIFGASVVTANGVFGFVISAVSESALNNLGEALTSVTGSDVVAELGIAEGAFLRGPRARDFVICFN